MSTAIKHPVPDRVKLSFVFLISGHSDAQPVFIVLETFAFSVLVLKDKKYHNTGNAVH